MDAYLVDFRATVRNVTAQISIMLRLQLHQQHVNSKLYNFLKENSMTDKVQKIREEVEMVVNRRLNLLNGDYFDLNKETNGFTNEIINIIDSLQEEPSIPEIVDEHYWEMLGEEPVSIWHDAREKPKRDDLLIETNDGRIIHRQSINNYGMVKRWAYTSDLLNLDNSCNFGNNLQEEPVGDDLGEYINELSKQFPEVSFAKLSRIAVRVAKWQEKQDQKTIELAEDHAMLAGMEKMKERMMKNAIELEVKKDAGGYPYIDCIELYDYDKDVPLANEGDKYKVILIKEE